jgi:hypothetical protein
MANINAKAVRVPGCFFCFIFHNEISKSNQLTRICNLIAYAQNVCKNGNNFFEYYTRIANSGSFFCE